MFPCESTRKNLAIGEYKKELGLIEVIVEKGKQMHNLGFKKQGKSYLFIEEAV